LVTGTDFVTQPVQDYEAASKFYGETLGLEFSKRWGNMPAGEFETGSLTIALMQSEAFGMQFRPSTSAIALHVEDVEAARAELEAKGIEFKGETDRLRRLPSGDLRRHRRQPADSPQPLRTEVTRPG